MVDEEISFHGVGYKGGDNSEDAGQLVDGSGVVKSPSQNFGCVEGMAEEKLVARPAVHGTTAGTRRGPSDHSRIAEVTFPKRLTLHRYANLVADVVLPLV